jgi:signal transduction histidine kinase
MLQVAFDAASEAMVIVDSELRVRWANQAAADLWSGGMAIALVGKRFSQLIHLQTLNGTPLSANEPGHPLREMRAGDGEGRYRMCLPEELGGLMSTRQFKWQLIKQTVEYNVLITVRDLDPTEQALQEQQAFMNHLAHELRTPLAIVTGSLKRIDQSASLNGRPAEHLDIARQEVKRIGRLLENLTLLSDIETGRHRFEFKTQHLHELIKGWVNKLEQPSRQRLGLNLMGCSKETAIKVDPEAFNRILDNLFENSLRYSKNNAAISLMATSQAESLNLFFMDWGSGIPEAQRSKIFDRFRRLEENRDPNQTDGSGLGLALTRSLIEGMDGLIELMPNETFDPSQPATVLRLQFPCEQIKPKTVQAGPGEISNQTMPMAQKLERTVEDG